MSKLNVGILYGGKSTEHEVSLRSAESVLGALDTDKYNVSLIYITKTGEWLLSHNSDEIKSLTYDEAAGVSIIPSQYLATSEGPANLDVIIPVLHGTAGEDGKVQGILELSDIPYVGCNVRSSAVCMDKDMTKRLLQIANISVADSVVYKHHEKGDVNYGTVTETLGQPLFIKPVNQGSSVGVSKVTDEASFYEAFDLAFQFDTKVMIESAVEGREIEVSVLGNTQPYASVPGEIVSNVDFYSYESKYIDEDGATLMIPAELDEETMERIQDTATETFKELDCEGMVRVDMFLMKDGGIIVNEINTLPGFTSISMYPKLLEVSGISYTELIDKLIELALERHNVESRLNTDIIF